MGLFDKSGQHFDKSGQPLDADYEHVAPMASESDDLIASVEKIVEKAKRSGMGDALLKDVDEEALHIAEWLKITQRQSVMLSLFLNFSYSDRIEIGEISRYLECSPVRLMRYQADIDELVNRCMLFYDFDRCSYRLSKQLYASLTNKTVFQPFKIDCSSYVEFYETLSKLFECLKNDEFTSEMLSHNIDRLLEGSKNEPAKGSNHGSKCDCNRNGNCDSASCIMRSIRQLCDYERIEGYGRCRNKFGF